MNDRSETIRRIGERFGNQIADLLSTTRTVSMTVVSTDEVSAYCRIYDDDEPLAIPLRTLNIGEGTIMVTPSVDSVVGVGFLDGSEDEPFINTYTQIDSIFIERGSVQMGWVVNPEDETQDIVTIRVGESSFTIKKDMIQLNNGSNDGLVLINELTTALNGFRDEIANFVTTYNGHTHSFTWSGTAGTAVTLAPGQTASEPSSFDKSDYENELITQ